MSESPKSTEHPEQENDLPVGEMPTPPAWQLPVSLVAWLAWLAFLAVCNAYST